MTSDMRKGHRELLEDFIQTYKSLPCLWQVQSKEYTDRQKKEAGYSSLLEILKVMDPEADRDAVLRKINSMRTNFRRERKKIEKARRTDIPYTPTLWYYHLFDFLNSPDARRPTSFNLNDIDGEDDEQADENSEGDEDESIVDTKATVYEIASCSPEQIVIQGAPKKTFTPVALKRPKQDKSDNCKEQKIEQNSKKSKSNDDRYDIFGKNVALRMKDITNSTQRLLVEKMISDALFMAEMGHLTMSHSIRINTGNNPQL